MQRSRRWDSSQLPDRDRSNPIVAARPSEVDIAAPKSAVVGSSAATQWQGVEQHRWAGPGASYPLPRPGSYTAEQYLGTLPGKASSGGCSESGKGDLPLASSGTRRRPLVNVVWHKNSDLRLHDHEPLSRAHLERPKLPVVHLHAFDPFWFGRTKLGGFRKTGALRSIFWQECVRDLRISLRERGQDLFIKFGISAGQALRQLSNEVDVAKVFTYAEVCSEELEREVEFEASLKHITRGTGEIVRCWGYTIHHVEDLKACAKPPEKWITPYLSFGTFKKEIAACRVRPVGFEWQKHAAGSGSSILMLPPPELDETFWGTVPTLEDLGFAADEISKASGTSSKSRAPLPGGESTALAHLTEYIWEQRALKQYVGTTDWTAFSKCSAPRNQTSKLSAHLAFGCLSPRLLYWEILRFEKGDRCKGTRGLINSLLWRDFYRFIVHYAWGNRMFHLYGPQSCGSVPGGHKVPTKWCCKHYNNIFGGSDPRLWEWGKDRAILRKWMDGTTGFPFVDAAMLELRETGYMLHLNRETVGWFFVRDLKLDWRLAAEWFESRLLDYDCVLNWGNWCYFILTQLPAREDDRPGGGPRYTLPRYSPYLMATQVLAWGKEHDPSAKYIKSWLPQLSALPPELAREPWRLKMGDVQDPIAEKELLAAGGEALAWACTSCTLENPLLQRSCDACGTRRPSLATTFGELVKPEGLQTQSSCLGVYSEQPMVPPPPEDEGWHGACEACGQIDAGHAAECGEFFCESCWGSWALERSLGVSDLNALESPSAPGGAVLKSNVSIAQSSKGWALVPEHALPGAVSGALSSEVVMPSDAAAELSTKPAVNTLGERKKGARWAVRGERSSVAGKAAGG